MVKHQARDPQVNETKALERKVVEEEMEEDDENILCN
ncbi:hypothetical protein A2U01_0097529, partial [Trifolium medium]|nr:hypothetical protein [Trifolium medium]